MPNPYDDELKRDAQVGMLRDQPVSTTMPVRGDSRGDFLRLTERFTPNPSGLTSLMGDSEFRGRFPNARVHKNDWLDLGDGGGLIDAVESFDQTNDTGTRWQYLTEADAIRGKQVQGRGRAPNPQALMAADNSAITRILAELTAASDDDQSPAAREAILQMLQGGF